MHSKRFYVQLIKFNLLPQLPNLPTRKIKHITALCYYQSLPLCVVCPVVILEFELQHHCYLACLPHLHPLQVATHLHVLGFTVPRLQQHLLHYATPSRS